MLMMLMTTMTTTMMSCKKDSARRQVAQDARSETSAAIEDKANIEEYSLCPASSNFNRLHQFSCALPINFGRLVLDSIANSAYSYFVHHVVLHILILTYVGKIGLGVSVVHGANIIDITKTNMFLIRCQEEYERFRNESDSKLQTKEFYSTFANLVYESISKTQTDNRWRIIGIDDLLGSGGSPTLLSPTA
eukprot:6457482-Amphidinium_carterae.1